MAARKKKQPVPPPPKADVRTAFVLTADTDEVLSQLRQQAKDELGRTISSSAIIRAVMTFVGNQGPLWAREQLLPLIEQELSSGVKWGKPKGMTS